jgi:hypothetical protein
MNGSYTDYSGIKWSFNNIEVNLDLFYPNLIVKIPSTESVAWDNANDYVSLPTYEYELILKNGGKEKISIGEISKNTNAILAVKGIGLNDLMCCTWLNVEDLQL